MNATQPLYDLSPALHVMLLGAIVALGPLAWVWLRNAGADARGRLAALTLLVLFLTFDLVLFGAFTRLTDSGLGCPDWPGCYGAASPSGAAAQISAAQASLPSGPVTHAKAWIEMIHRYLATAVGVLIIAIAAATWWGRGRERMPVNPWWPTLTLAWVCVQGAFGALTVTMKLQPAIVTLHLLGGMVLLALLSAQAVAYRVASHEPPRTSSPSKGVPSARATIEPHLRTLLVAAYAFLWLQIALGGWVSTNYAVLACTDFPRCHGTWWPDMNFQQGFELWRALGKTSAGEPIEFAALTAIHYVHRLAALAVILALAACAWRLWTGPLARQARWLAALAAWQFASGLSNVVLGWPLAAAVAHTGGAAALVVVLTWALCASRSEARTVLHAREVSA
ncbi:MAG TPA: COX15/CtaA family protein [Ramlibacter sp.]|uniref:COX15/CtaA family protein n=1 Tax=Ramlibacter sp. TaxID=1917967 RepID=UPI002CD01B14|nr:COX15/CtaA family protein [Ramlibacter sp.]HVZ44547.1 COX15/CtaA family protein [Ramlibacter sp.]